MTASTLHGRQGVSKSDAKRQGAAVVTGVSSGVGYAIREAPGRIKFPGSSEPATRMLRVAEGQTDPLEISMNGL